jgi:hypothetical protein
LASGRGSRTEEANNVDAWVISGDVTILGGRTSDIQSPSR